MGLPSIRGRLARSLFYACLLWAAAVSLALWLVIRHEVDELLDTTLQESAEILAGLLRFKDNFGVPLSAGALPENPHEERLAWQLVNTASGTLVIKSYTAPSTPMAASDSQGFSEAAAGWRVFSLRIQPGDHTLHVGQSLAERFEARTEAVGIPVGAALLVGALSALWLRSRVQSELEPLSAMARSIARLDLEHFETDFAPPTRQELAAVQGANLSLAKKLKHRVESERAFSAHAAHALRTPLAAIVAQLAAAEASAPESTLPYLRNSGIAAQQLGHVVSALMALFHAGQTIHPQNIDLKSIIDRLPRDARLTIRVIPQEDFFADPDLVAAVLINLFDNSVRYGATRVDVMQIHIDGWDRLIIQDNGLDAMASPASAATAFKPAAMPSSASGLGLALAQLVAKVHGGEMASGLTEVGYRVELRWPTLRQDDARQA